MRSFLRKYFAKQSKSAKKHFAFKCSISSDELRTPRLHQSSPGQSPGSGFFLHYRDRLRCLLQHLFERLQVLNETLAARTRKKHCRPRLGIDEGFFDANRLGFLKCFQMATKVPIGKITFALEIVKSQTVNRLTQCRHNRQAI